MWTLMLVLTLVASAHACADQECDACIAGRCHSRRTLLEGFSVTDQLAIDRTRNTLYTQLNNDTIIAFLLDEGSIRKVLEAETNGLAFDQQNQLLYTSEGPIITKYKYGQDTSSVDLKFAHVLNRITNPIRLRYEDTLYTINADGSCAYYSKRSYQFAGYENLHDYKVTDMVNVKDKTYWFFISDNKLYKFVISATGRESWHLMSDRRYVLSIGGHGDNYFADPSEKIIYKLDRETGELKEYGWYNSGSVEDFVFDRDENIVYRDADGSVARWVPGPVPCEVAPRGITYQVDELIPNNYLHIKLLPNEEDTFSSTTQASSEDTYSYYDESYGTRGIE